MTKQVPSLAYQAALSRSKRFKIFPLDKRILKVKQMTFSLKFGTASMFHLSEKLFIRLYMRKMSHPSEIVFIPVSLHDYL